MRLLTILILVLLTFGCSKPSITPAPVSTPTDYAKEQPLTKVRDYLYHNLKPEFPIYGIVIFTDKPTTIEQTKQYELICKYWENTQFTRSELGISNDTDVFITYWPITNTANKSCKGLHNYDYVRAQNIVNKLHITKPGPMLIAVYENDYIVLEHIELYLNNLNSKDIERAFNIWKYELVVSNKGWNELFNISYLKEKFRHILNLYGEQIINVKEG